MIISHGCGAAHELFLWQAFFKAYLVIRIPSLAALYCHHIWFQTVIIFKKAKIFFSSSKYGIVLFLSLKFEIFASLEN